MKILKKVLLILAILLITLIIFKDIVIAFLINSVGSSLLGAPVKVGSFRWGVFSQQIKISNLRIDNPQGFPKQSLINIPEIAVNYNVQSLLKGDLYFPYINVDVKEVTIVRNEEGKLNVEALKTASVKKEPAPEQKEKPQPKEKKQDIALTIDEMKLNLGQTVYLDYSKGGEPTKKVFDVGLRNKTFRNIKSVQQLVATILVQGMSPAAIKSVALNGASSLLSTAASLPPAAVSGVLEQLDQKIFNRK